MSSEKRRDKVMNKEIYETPVTEIIRFETEDILTDSAREDELKIIPIE